MSCLRASGFIIIKIFVAITSAQRALYVNPLDLAYINTVAIIPALTALDPPPAKAINKNIVAGKGIKGISKFFDDPYEVFNWWISNLSIKKFKIPLFKINYEKHIKVDSELSDLIKHNKCVSINLEEKTFSIHLNKLYSIF